MVLILALQVVQFNSVPIDPTTDLNGQYEKRKLQLQKQNSKDSPNQLVPVDRETEIKLEKQRQKIIHDRIKVLINHLKTYGIPEKYIFDIGDLMDLANVPKVTRCVAMMAKMVRSLLR